MREATEVHHIKHLDEYPELAYDNDNLVSLCHACHNARHPEKGRTARKKYEKVSDRGAGTRKIAKNFGSEKAADPRPFLTRFRGSACWPG